MRRRKTERLISFLAAIWLVLACVPARSQPEGSRPVKIVVESADLTVHAGERVELAVGLQDAVGRTAEAPKPLLVELEVRSHSGQAESLKLRFEPGDTSKKALLSVRDTGLVKFHARQPELLEGGGLLNVIGEASNEGEEGAGIELRLEGEEPRSGEAIRQEARARFMPPPPPATMMRTRESQPAAAGPIYQSLPPGEHPLREVRGEGAMAHMASQPVPPSLGQGSGAALSSPRLRLFFTPERGLLANGHDAATIYAFLQDMQAGAQREFMVQLVQSVGELEPIPLVIPQGEYAGTAGLTSTQPGAVRVSYIGTQPPVELAGSGDLTIPFEPPITGFKLRASPPRISLVDAADLVVQLVDDGDIGTATDRPRQVSLTLEAGRGELQPANLTVPVDSFEARSQFLPTWWGIVEVEAVTNGLLNQRVEIDVSVPIVLLLLTLGGGLIGGCIASVADRKRLLRRSLIGMVCGFVLYWAFVFGLLDRLPRSGVLNPASAIVIALLGGWLGTEVLKLAAKSLGLGVANP